MFFVETKSSNAPGSISDTLLYASTRKVNWSRPLNALFWIVANSFFANDKDSKLSNEVNEYSFNSVIFW